ncbi:hypothetical protein FZEAL_6061 [Fusarium zealandicum]|uniref:C6 transcription factor n=1 Tax=Fusarium zealandicum TaxID=1053134 RepID=A0A8H4UIG6_9HYPO|nr:hypothetical protein FZEAL_6061 [Fusarium zealandicum]
MVTTRATSRAVSAGPESASPSPPPDSKPPSTPSTSRKRLTKSSANTASKKRRFNVERAPTWHHAPSTTTLLWLAVSVPLVTWDTVYVLGRPHTMPGGPWHWPLWVPYELYGQVDHVYGWKAWNSNNGFTGAQSALNVVECIMYLVYLWMIWTRADAKTVDGVAKRTISGRNGALAALVGFSAAVMTVSKTALYGAHEYYSGFDNISHNSLFDIFYLWVLPNGFWIILPTYMVLAFGNNILDGLVMASGQAPQRKSSVTTL